MEREHNIYDATHEQAKSMARFIGADLSQGQIENYVEARTCDDENVCGLSDQEILYLFLDDEQRALFEASYSNINLELANKLIWG